MYKDFTRPANVGHFFVAISIEAFIEKKRFFERVDTLVNAIYSMHTRPDAYELRLPGERKYKVQEERLRKGIPLEDSVVSELKTLADEAGAPWDACDTAS